MFTYFFYIENKQSYNYLKNVRSFCATRYISYQPHIFCLKNTEEVSGIIYHVKDGMQVTHPLHSHKYAYQTGRSIQMAYCSCIYNTKGAHRLDTCVHFWTSRACMTILFFNPWSGDLDLLHTPKSAACNDPNELSMRLPVYLGCSQGGVLPLTHWRPLVNGLLEDI